MGGPGYLENTIKQIKLHLVLWTGFSGILLIGIGWLMYQYSSFSGILILGLLIVVWLILSTIFGFWLTNKTTEPLVAISNTILRLSPTPIPINPVDTQKLKIGRELTENLIRQINHLTAQGGDIEPVKSIPENIMQQLPVAVLVIDDNSNITFANTKAEQIANKKGLASQNLYSTFDIIFQDKTTLSDWMVATRSNSVTAQKIWRGARVSVSGMPTCYVDIAATFSMQADNNAIVYLTLFDQNNFYANQDNSLSFIALAVHELRTPLTILRGYIEVLEEELTTQNDPQLHQIMLKMKASAENLTAFVGNILDVARVEQNQLTLKLAQEDWPKVLTAIVEDMQLRARVHGKNIELSLGENIPAVGIDRVSIAEVLTNLLDNAIKYSPPDKKLIRVTSAVNQEGDIETSVQDFGVGIPETVMPHLFEKFSRNHRNRASIGGTGLGLYLSKALISAHRGNIWVRSHEGEGSIFSFTVLPFSKVANMQENNDNAITRNTHGWIKNHSLSRR